MPRQMLRKIGGQKSSDHVRPAAGGKSYDHRDLLIREGNRALGIRERRARKGQRINGDQSSQNKRTQHCRLPSVTGFARPESKRLPGHRCQTLKDVTCSTEELSRFSRVASLPCPPRDDAFVSRAGLSFCLGYLPRKVRE